MATNIIYEEYIHPWFVPLVFFLPCFYKYGLQIAWAWEDGYGEEKEIVDQTSNNLPLLPSSKSITFGYGFSGPSSSITGHKSMLNDIDPNSVSVGESSWNENLLTFGGWGIRYGFFQSNPVWAYVPTFKGSYCEFDEVIGAKRTRYRIVTKNAERVASLLRCEE